MKRASKKQMESRKIFSQRSKQVSLLMKKGMSRKMAWKKVMLKK